MATVAIIACNSYEPETVKAAVSRGLSLLGGMENFIDKTENILLKPNLLSASPPEKCVTTHPAVFRAVAESALEAGAVVSYGDSPAIGGFRNAARRAGLAAVARELAIGAADFRTGVDVSFPEGKQNRTFTIARGVLESDGVISLPKFKTHGFQKVTGAVKNQFGCIPGVLKGEYHVKLSDAMDFAKMLVDVARFVNPRLFIMDGIDAMEGNGPGSGTPKQLGVILLSSDPVALDATACRLVDLDPRLVPAVLYGGHFDFGTFQEEEIDLVGDDISSLVRSDFDVDRSPIRPYRKGGMTRFLSNFLVPKPVIIERKCIRCGLCVEMCPAVPKALLWFDGDRSKPPRHDYSCCIRCYCCQEVCPEGAIELQVPLMRSILNPLIT